MEMEQLNNVNDQEVKVQRALLDPTASAVTTISLEDLKAQRVVVTPTDTPLYSSISRRARQVTNQHFSWNESTLNSTFTANKYTNGNTSSLAAISGSTPSKKGNYIMSIGTVAKVSGIVDATRVTDDNGGGSMEVELNDKYALLVRTIEYFLWKGDHTTNADEMDGIASIVTTAVQNNGGGGDAPLDVNSLDLAIVQMYNAGLSPSALYCSPFVAQRIASFASGRVQYNDTVQAMNGIGQKAFMYASPFGYVIQVKPTRSDFLPASTAYLLDESKIRLCYMGSAVEQTERLAKIDDTTSVLMKAYVSIEVQNKTAHRAIEEVSNDLA